jgi:hypothetical protein
VGRAHTVVAIFSRHGTASVDGVRGGAVAEPSPRQEQQEEPVEAAMWVALEGLARFSQASVIHRVGLFMRFEAIRTERQQTRFQPL